LLESFFKGFPRLFLPLRIAGSLFSFQLSAILPFLLFRSSSGFLLRILLIFRFFPTGSLPCSRASREEVLEDTCSPPTFSNYPLSNLPFFSPGAMPNSWPPPPSSRCFFPPFPFQVLSSFNNSQELSIFESETSPEFHFPSSFLLRFFSDS